jgi:YidC/Oxa1 family membrane protein insertase
MIAGINEKGGNIISIKMKKYLYTEGNRKGEYVDLIPQNSEGGAQISVAGESLKDKIFKYNGESEKKVEIEKGNKKDLVFEHTLKNGDVIKKNILFYGRRISDRNEGIRNSTEWGENRCKLVERNRRKRTSGSQPEQRIVHYSDGSSVQHINMRKTEKEEITGNYRWIGVTSKYFFISIVSDSVRDADLTIKGFETDAKEKTGNQLNL